MNDTLNYYVDLKADFNRVESLEKPSGEELANIIATGLPSHGITIRKIEGVDFCHYIECDVGSSTIELMVGEQLLDETKSRWDIQPCAKRSIFGRDRVPDENYRLLLSAVDTMLRECDRISDIRWFPGFETPEYLALMPYSAGPIRDPDYEKRLHPLTRLDWLLNRAANLTWGPIGIISFVILACVLGVLMPKTFVPVITVLFFAILALGTIIPFVLSVLMRREAKRITATGGEPPDAPEPETPDGNGE